MSRRSVATAVFWLLLAAWGAKSVVFFLDRNWDYQTYYNAARVWEDGRDPYERSNLPIVAGAGRLPFLYPPYTLPAFSLLLRVPPTVAAASYLVLKLALFGWLMIVWGRLLQTRLTVPWVLFVLFAFAGSVYSDFMVGNVTIFEQWVLWMGFALLLKKKYLAFSAAIIAASLFKLTLVGLAIIYLWVPDRRRYHYLAGTLLAFGAILAATYWVSPELTTSFVRAVAGFWEGGRTNPAALPLVRDAFGLWGQAFRSPLANVTYLALVAAIAAITWLTVRRIARMDAPDRLTILFFFLVASYAVAMPRFKIYSYILLIAPTYFIIVRARLIRVAVPLAVIVCVPADNWMLSPEVNTLIWNYSSWFVALGTWGLYVYEFGRSSNGLPPRLPHPELSA